MIGIKLGLTYGGAPTMLQQALSAIRRNGGTLLLPGASTPVLGEELLPSTDLTTWVSGGAFGNWASTTATADTITTTGVNGSRRIRLACTPGTTYWFSARVMGGTGLGSVAIAFGTSAAVYITHKDETFVADGTINTLLTAPANAAFVEFCVRGGNTGQTATFAEFRTGVFSGYTHGNPALRNYLDSAGTDLLDSVTQVDQPVGLALDSMGVLGPELVPASYSGSVTGSWVISPASITRNGTTSTACSLALLSATSAAKAYQVAFVVSGLSGDAFTVNVGGANVGQIASDGAKTFVVSGGGAGMGFVPWSGTAGQVTITSISVREIPGNHATQPTPASKPLLRRGLVNQLLWSGGFTNAAWTKAGATVVTGQADPFGGTAASKLVESATNSAHYFLQLVVSGTGTATSAWVVKPAGRTKIQIRSEAPQTGMLATMFNLATGAIQNGTGSIVALDNGFFLCVATAPSNGTGANGYHLVQTLNDSWQETYTGDGTSGILLHRAALFQGTVTAQQILAAGGIPLTTTAPASAERGNYAWQFDGSNDFLQTGITTGNEGWVCAGVTFGGAAGAMETITYAGGTSNTNKGVWLARIGPVSENQLWCGVSDGTIRNIAIVPSVPLRNTPRVVSGGWTASSVLASVDNTEVTEARTNGTAAPGITPMAIGSISSASLNGPMSATVYCPVLPSAADRALICRWVGSLQGQTL